MPHESPLAVVLAWQDAANRHDVDRLLEQSDTNIEIVGPRGSGHGHQLLRDWLGRAGLTLETRRIFARGDVAVLHQHGTWRDVETGELSGEREVASVFRVDGGRVARIARYDGLGDALVEAGLDERDEVPAP